jgi:hypothetical protein
MAWKRSTVRTRPGPPITYRAALPIGYNLKLELASVQVIVRSPSLLFFLFAIFFHLPVKRKPGKPNAGG